MNSILSEAALIIILITSAVTDSIGTGIECKENRFWAFNSATGTIDEFEFNGNTITFVSQVMPIPGPSLAFCNNLNGGTFSPTFYTHISTFSPTLQNVIMYYNGTTWDSAATLTILPSGCGGYGSHLYFTGGGAGVDMYDGNSVTHFPSSSGMIADLAVDVVGNAWLAVYSGGTTISEIRVLSPSGQIIQTYTLSVPTTIPSPFGCFFMFNNLYIGSHMLNSIFPVSFSGNNAYLGSPINLPAGSYSDLASCSPIDFTSSVKEINNAIFFPYPNPSAGVFRFSPERLIESISIRNLLGKEILFSTTSEIDLTDFANEIYFYTLNTISGELLTGTLIKN